MKAVSQHFSPRDILSLYLTYFIKIGPAPREGLAQAPTELTF